MAIEKADPSDQEMEQEYENEEPSKQTIPNGHTIHPSTKLDENNDGQSNGMVIGTHDETNELSKLPGFNFGFLLSTGPKTRVKDVEDRDDSEKHNPTPFQIDEQKDGRL